jgi:hypothetical protein
MGVMPHRHGANQQTVAKVGHPIGGSLAGAILPGYPVVLGARHPYRFHGDNAAIDKAFIPAEFFRSLSWARKVQPELEQDPGFFPGLEPPPPGTGTARPPEELAPWGAGPQDPEDALKTALSRDVRASPSG